MCQVSKKIHAKFRSTEVGDSASIRMSDVNRVRSDPRNVIAVVMNERAFLQAKNMVFSKNCRPMPEVSFPFCTNNCSHWLTWALKKNHYEPITVRRWMLHMCSARSCISQNKRRTNWTGWRRNNNWSIEGDSDQDVQIRISNDKCFELSKPMPTIQLHCQDN